jgi:hypothetical protein
MKIEFASEGIKTRSVQCICGGCYEAAITEISLRKALSGNRHFEVDFEIRQGEYAGRHAWATICLTDDTHLHLDKLLRAANIDHFGEFDTKDLPGRVLGISLRNEKGPDGNYRPTVIHVRELANQCSVARARTKK